MEVELGTKTPFPNGLLSMTTQLNLLLATLKSQRISEKIVPTALAAKIYSSLKCAETKLNRRTSVSVRRRAIVSHMPQYRLTPLTRDIKLLIDSFIGQKVVQRKNICIISNRAFNAGVGFSVFSVMGKHLERIHAEPVNTYINLDKLIADNPKLAGIKQVAIRDFQVIRIIDDRKYFLGETSTDPNVGYMNSFLNDKNPMTVEVQAIPSRNIMNWVYQEGVHVFFTIDREIIVKTPTLLQPVTLKDTFFKFYYQLERNQAQRRYNMNRNVEFDKHRVYFMGSFGSNQEKPQICYYNMSDLRASKGLANLAANVIPNMQYLECFCISKRYIFAVHCTGAVVRISKGNFNFQKVDMEYMRLLKTHTVTKSSFETLEQRREGLVDFFSSIASNDYYVFAAGTSNRSTFRLYNLKLKLLDTSYKPWDGEYFNPIHNLKFIVLKDLCCVLVLSRRETLNLFALHRNKIKLIQHINMSQSKSYPDRRERNRSVGG